VHAVREQADGSKSGHDQGASLGRSFCSEPRRASAG
jgi:hypothetical protein